jgi:hypothetical protein
VALPGQAATPLTLTTKPNPEATISDLLHALDVLLAELRAWNRELRRQRLQVVK